MNVLKFITSNLPSFFLGWNPQLPPLYFLDTRPDLTIIPASQKLEEENWKWYTSEYFYPVHIGEVFESRYQVLYKLGYGTTSTVWMCRDLQEDKYVCVKSICQNHPSFHRELEAYDRLSHAASLASADKKHEMQWIRQILDHFQVRRHCMQYSFIVQEPMGISMGKFLELSGNLPIGMVQAFAAKFLRTLDFIHSTGVIHTDIHPGNIFNRINDESLFRELEEDELVNPSPGKITEDGTIFATKRIDYLGNIFRLFGLNENDLVLCDFGEARILVGKGYFRETIQPVTVRAPEVFMRIAWRQTADIWSLGCMLWEFATGEPLFPRTRGEANSESADSAQLATMVALIGTIPSDILKLYQIVLPDVPLFFNEDGSPISAVPQQTFESRLASAMEHAVFPMTLEEQREFIAFMRRVMVWDFDKRPCAAVLLKDPWVSDGR